MDSKAHGRRRLLKTLAAAGGAYAGASVLPSRWTKPAIDSLVIPVHAQASELPLVQGVFTTGQAVAFAPVQGIVPTGLIVGNGVFNITWDLTPSGYEICGEGNIQTGNGNAFVQLSGSGGRSGNMLNDYSESTGFGTLSFTDQLASETGISFEASFQSDTTTSVANPGGSCEINNTTWLHLSSPFKDDPAV